MRAYAHQGGDHEFAFWAGEIKLRAERKAGELLKETAETGERATEGRPQKQSHAATISELGINKSQSARWQQEAGLSKRDRKQPAHASEVVKAVQNAERRKAAERGRGSHRTDAGIELAALADSGYHICASSALISSIFLRSKGWPK